MLKVNKMIGMIALIAVSLIMIAPDTLHAQSTRSASESVSAIEGMPGEAGEILAGLKVAQEQADDALKYAQDMYRALGKDLQGCNTIVTERPSSRPAGNGVCTVSGSMYDKMVSLQKELEGINAEFDELLKEYGEISGTEIQATLQSLQKQIDELKAFEEKIAALVGKEQAEPEPAPAPEPVVPQFAVPDKTYVIDCSGKKTKDNPGIVEDGLGGREYRKILRAISRVIIDASKAGVKVVLNLQPYADAGSETANQSVSSRRAAKILTDLDEILVEMGEALSQEDKDKVGYEYSLAKFKSGATGTDPKGRYVEITITVEE